MIPWYYKTQSYRNYWRMDNGTYPYKILFYEKEGDELSCKDKFPLTLSDNSTVTKDEFVEIVKEAFEQLSSLNIGLTFTYDGHDTTDRDPAFNMVDNVNALVYYWNYNFGGLSAPFSNNGFGVKLALLNKGERDWYIGSIRHELTHALGFAHKGNMFGASTDKMPFVMGGKTYQEFTKDTIHGFDAVYDIKTKYKIIGKVNPIKYKEGQAFIVQHNELIYQTVIDGDGYFEFRLREKLHRIRILIMSKQGNVYNYAFLRNPIKLKFDPKKLKEGSTTSLLSIGKLARSKLIY